MLTLCTLWIALFWTYLFPDTAEMISSIVSLRLETFPLRLVYFLLLDGVIRFGENKTFVADYIFNVYGSYYCWGLWAVDGVYCRRFFMLIVLWIFLLDFYIYNSTKSIESLV